MGNCIPRVKRDSGKSKDCILVISHLLDTGLETVSRVRLAVLQKLMLCDNHLIIVTSCLTGIDCDKKTCHGKVVLAGPEVLMVMDENVVLEGAAEMQVQLVISSTGIPLKAKSVASTKLHGGISEWSIT